MDFPRVSVGLESYSWIDNQSLESINVLMSMHRALWASLVPSVLIHVRHSYTRPVGLAILVGIKNNFSLAIHLRFQSYFRCNVLLMGR